LSFAHAFHIHRCRGLFVFCAVDDFPPRGALLKLEMMRPIESSSLRVGGIVETCINVAEINRAREFYQSLFNFEAMVSDERFCALRAGTDVLLLFTHGGSSEPVVIRGGIIPPHETRGTGHLAFAISSDDLETWRAQLLECGIEIESEVRWERGGASLYFRDPDANLLELATPGVWPNY
jgi:catechol 2,3-dioxygenase-like lactoylglutathione lyase family enzyme